jgi:mRNA interferase HicA
MRLDYGAPVLLARIAEAASTHGLSATLIRQGRRHEFWEVGEFRFAVPRHREINEWTAEGIMRDLEPMFERDWWRR